MWRKESNQVCPPVMQFLVVAIELQPLEILKLDLKEFLRVIALVYERIPPLMGKHMGKRGTQFHIFEHNF